MKYFKWVLTNEANVKIVKFNRYGTPIEAFGEVKDALKFFNGSILYKNFFMDMDLDRWKEISESQYNAIKKVYSNPFLKRKKL
jgi:hypothetical protein